MSEDWAATQRRTGRAAAGECPVLALESPKRCCATAIRLLLGFGRETLHQESGSGAQKRQPEQKQLHQHC